MSAIVLTQAEIEALIDSRIDEKLTRLIQDAIREEVRLVSGLPQPTVAMADLVDVLDGYLPKKRPGGEVAESDELWAKQENLLECQTDQIRTVFLGWLDATTHPRREEILDRMYGFMIRSPGDVYFAKSTPGDLIKIGASLNVRNRLAYLRDTGGMIRLDCVAYAPGGAQFEKFLHHTFRESREGGEWFRPTAELVGLIRVVRSTDWVWE